jgi:hypothetical protein
MSGDPNSLWGAMTGRKEWQKFFPKLQYFYNHTVSKDINSFRSRLQSEKDGIINILKNKDVTMGYLMERWNKYSFDDKNGRNLTINFYSGGYGWNGKPKGEYVPEIVADNLLFLADTTDSEAGPKIREIVNMALEREIKYLKGEIKSSGKPLEPDEERVLTSFTKALKQLKLNTKGGMRTRKYRSKTKNKRTRRC